MAAPGGPERIDRGALLALGAMALGVFVIANDFTALRCPPSCVATCGHHSAYQRISTDSS